jgi:radical SAM superfamily enzyme YgiQ (UPF0313 family)
MVAREKHIKKNKSMDDIKMTKKINKVALVYPNQRWYKDDQHTVWNLNPYTLCLLADMISPHVDEVKIIDAQFDKLSLEEFEEKIREFGPDLVGVSILTTEYCSIGNITIDIIKKINQDTVIVAGGVHVTLMYNDVIQNTNIDYAIRGEGEYVFQELIQYLNGEAPMPSVGLVYKDKESGEVIAQEHSIISDITKLPIPNYSYVDFKKYTMVAPREGVDAPPLLPYARVQTSRGCPIGCTFCQVESISGKKLRKRSAENIIEELEYLIREYGIKSVVFEDDNPFADRARTKKLLKLMIEKNLNLKWKATGVYLPAMDEEIFELMSKSGCIMLNIAIESGNERVLKEIIHKPLKLESVFEKVALAHKYGLYIVANFIIGLPGESFQEMRDTFKFAEDSKIDYSKFFIANVFNGTKLYDYAVANNYVDETHDEYDVSWRYSRIKSDEWSSEEISFLRLYEWDRINFSDPKKRERTANMMNISIEKLEEIRKNSRKALLEVFYPKMHKD